MLDGRISSSERVARPVVGALLQQVEQQGHPCLHRGQPLRIRQHIAGLGQHLPFGAPGGPHHAHTGLLCPQQGGLQRMVNGPVASAGHHQPPHTGMHQRIHGLGPCPCVAQHHLHPRPFGGFNSCFDSRKGTPNGRKRPILHKAHPPLLHPSQGAGIARIEGMQVDVLGRGRSPQPQGADMPEGHVGQHHGGVGEFVQPVVRVEHLAGHDATGYRAAVAQRVLAAIAAQYDDFRLVLVAPLRAHGEGQRGWLGR